VLWFKASCCCCLPSPSAAVCAQTLAQLGVPAAFNADSCQCTRGHEQQCGLKLHGDAHSVDFISTSGASYTHHLPPSQPLAGTCTTCGPVLCAAAVATAAHSCNMQGAPHPTCRLSNSSTNTCPACRHMRHLRTRSLRCCSGGSRTQLQHARSTTPHLPPK
jgi:hypothetical protein